MPFAARHSAWLLLSVLCAACLSGCHAGNYDFASRLKLPWQNDAAVASRAKQRPARLTSTGSAQAPTPVITKQNQAQVQLAMAHALEKKGELKAATAAYEAALRNDSNLARGYHRLALCKEKSGKGEESKQLLLKAVELGPEDAEIACDLGYWFYLRRDWKQAEAYFRQAIAVDPAFSRAHNNLGLTLARSGRPDAATEHFAAAGLSEAESRTNLGIVYMTEHELPKAKLELSHALSIDPRAEKARNAWSSLASHQGAAQGADDGRRDVAHRVDQPRQDAPANKLLMHNTAQRQDSIQKTSHIAAAPPAAGKSPQLHVVDPFEENIPGNVAVENSGQPLSDPTFAPTRLTKTRQLFRGQNPDGETRPRRLPSTDVPATRSTERRLAKEKSTTLAIISHLSKPEAAAVEPSMPAAIASSYSPSLDSFEIAATPPEYSDAAEKKRSQLYVR